MVSDLSVLKDLDDKTFAKQVEADLSVLEKIRRVKLEVLKFRRKIGAIAALCGTPITGFIDYLLFFGDWRGDDPSGGLTLVFLGGLWYWTNEPKRQYAKSYKKKILPKIAKTLGNLHYVAKGKLIVNRLRASKIIPDYNRHECEDYFYGEYKGTKIELTELKLEYESVSGKNKTVTTVFDGLAFLIDVPKDVHGHTVLRPNQNGFFEWLNKKNLGLEQANLVSPEFEDVYDVYTNDQVEARYLVHPAMIEKFTTLSKEYEGGRLSAEYHNGKLLLMLPSKAKHFEPASIHIEATNVETLIDMKRELTAVISIVDELELIDVRRSAQRKTSNEDVSQLAL